MCYLPFLIGFLAFFILILKMEIHRAIWNSDEIDMASQAVAMTNTPTAWLRPNYHPFSQSSYNKMGEGIIAPPLSNGLMAIPGLLGISSPWGWPIVGSIIFLCGMCAFTAALKPISLLQIFCGVCAVMALSPRIVVDMLTLKPEGPMTGFSLISLAFPFLKGTKSKMIWYAGLSGFFTGLAFLCKLWLVGPIFLATCLAWWYKEGASWYLTVIYLTSTVFFCSSHLILVMIFDPESLYYWGTEVYFSPFLKTGIASTKWVGIKSHPEWSHGFWYYPFAIVRELGLGFALTIFGGYFIYKDMKNHILYQPQFIGVLIGLILGLVTLSIPMIKEPRYVLPLIGIGSSLAAFAFITLMTNNKGRYICLLLSMVALLISLILKIPREYHSDSSDFRHPDLRLSGQLPYFEDEKF